jgi:hypothetical protein
MGAIMLPWKYVTIDGQVGQYRVPLPESDASQRQLLDFASLVCFSRAFGDVAMDFLGVGVMIERIAHAYLDQYHKNEIDDFYTPFHELKES